MRRITPEDVRAGRARPVTQGGWITWERVRQADSKNKAERQR